METFESHRLTARAKDKGLHCRPLHIEPFEAVLAEGNRDASIAKEIISGNPMPKVVPHFTGLHLRERLGSSTETDCGSPAAAAAAPGLPLQSSV